MDYLLEQIERSRTRKTLERYVSKNVVPELLDNPATFFNTLGGVRKNVAILFSDIRGFTTMTEKTDSEQALVLQLNEYLQEMVRQVFKYDGTLDKFIGDAVMAVWGNILAKSPERNACNAVATALAMKRSLAALNADWKKRGIQELSIGIGINHGDCIVGNLGSAEKMDLTVIGDTVNLASRLEGLTKKFELDLLLGETVAPLVRGQFVLRTIAFVQAKGKTKPIEVFTVIGERGSVDPQIEAWLARYEEAVKLYRARQFAEALKIFQECLGTQPDDHMCATYASDCEALIQSPPDESWDAVLVMTEK
jgi:adenylate cyclase